MLDDAFGAGTTIAINVAAKQAGDLQFHALLCRKPEATADAPTVSWSRSPRTRSSPRTSFRRTSCRCCANIGVRVSIDDFGTGYSSLSVLADITADEIKIDRSFITAIHQRPRSQSVLKAIESLSTRSE